MSVGLTVLKLNDVFGMNGRGACWSVFETRDGVIVRGVAGPFANEATASKWLCAEAIERIDDGRTLNAFGERAGDPQWEIAGGRRRVIR